MTQNITDKELFEYLIRDTLILLHELHHFELELETHFFCEDTTYSISRRKSPIIHQELNGVPMIHNEIFDLYRHLKDFLTNLRTCLFTIDKPNI